MTNNNTITIQEGDEFIITNNLIGFVLTKVVEIRPGFIRLETETGMTVTLAGEAYFEDDPPSRQK